MWAQFGVSLTLALAPIVIAVLLIIRDKKDSLEDRIERENDDLRAENKDLAEKLSDCRDENLRLMRKLLTNGH